MYSKGSPEGWNGSLGFCLFHGDDSAARLRVMSKAPPLDSTCYLDPNSIRPANGVLQGDVLCRFGLWAPEGQRVFGTYHGNHISRFINGAVSLSGKRLFTATDTLVTNEVIGFFTDLLK